MSTHTAKRATGIFILCTLFLLVMGLSFYLAAAGTDGGNPRGNFWRVVREGIPGFTTVTTPGHTVLIQNSGENWRELRNGLLMKGSQWMLALAVLGAGLFYFFVGPDKLEKTRSGVKIERFSLKERVLHWYTALMFITQGVTGLSMFLGRLALLPIFGHAGVSGYLELAKVLHNYSGPLLLVGIFLESVTWVHFNAPKRTDLQWFKNMGGMIHRGPRPPMGRYNGGEKGWFWAMIIFGIGVGITGVLLDFPIWGQSRYTMQVSHVIHVIVSVLFVTASLGHIYVGTIGIEGVFEGMWNGSVDAVWAQQHADLWYREKMRKGK